MIRAARGGGEFRVRASHAARHRQTLDPEPRCNLRTRHMWRRTWIFDLDNTLHDAAPHILPHINRSMTEYLSGTSAWKPARRGAAAALLAALRRHAARPDAPPRQRPAQFHVAYPPVPRAASHAGARAALRPRCAACPAGSWCFPTRRSTTCARCCAPRYRRSSTGSSPSRARASGPSPTARLPAAVRSNNLQAQPLYHGRGHAGEPAHGRAARHVDGLGQRRAACAGVTSTSNRAPHGVAAMLRAAR